MSERVTLNMKDIKRLYVVQQVDERKMTAKEAAESLSMSMRQVRRLVAKYRARGAAGLVHGNRGQTANNRLEETVRVKIQELAQETYADYNDSHFTEELVEEHQLKVSRSTVRRIRREMGQKSPHKHRTPRHRSRRERKPKVGMLLQTDGSDHDWLEGRGPRLDLIAYIDDATNEVSGAVYREQEDAAGYFMGLREICKQRGIPESIYADRHMIFQSPSKATLEQELKGEEPKSQYGRLLDELGVKLIAAQSPQAKGRVERLWGTLQDRLVKALRKAEASSLEEANQVLKTFLPKFNQRFRVEPAESETAYIPWPKEKRLEDYFCFKHSRVVTNDNTISFGKQRLQIPPGPSRISYARKRVEVRQHLDGRLEIVCENERLAIFEPEDDRAVRMKKFTASPGQMAMIKPIEKSLEKPAVPRKPAANHPWRQYKSKGKEQAPDTQEQPQ